MKIEDQVNITLKKLAPVIRESLLSGNNYKITIDINHSKVLYLYSVKIKNEEINAVVL